LATNKEIEALLKLIDDPDEVVYENVSNKLISFGKEIIPTLENYWEHTDNIALQEKIEALIHQLHFTDLQTDFKKWNADNPDLLSGALLVCKYMYPTMDTLVVFKEIEKLRRNVWLELNSYLTPMEQINVIGSIIYNYYKQKGVALNYDNPDYFLLNKTIETHQGNTYGNGTLFLILCNLLDVPVYAVNIPNQFLLGYFYEHYNVMNVVGHAAEKIKFFIDPVNGQMYSQKDVDNYFKKLGYPPEPSFFHPLSNKNILLILLSELVKCFNRDTQYYKIEELRSLIKIIALEK
jgi:regulator of sirC expression with transglutaminase-like and TPR domain